MYWFLEMRVVQWWQVHRNPLLSNSRVRRPSEFELGELGALQLRATSHKNSEATAIEKGPCNVA